MASNENVLRSAWPPSPSGLVAPLALPLAGTASFDRELGMATDLHHSVSEAGHAHEGSKVPVLSPW